MKNVVNFLYVRYHNFQSFLEDTLFISGKKLVLIEGIRIGSSNFDSNGSGKSCLFEGLVWGLYGKLIREGSKSQDDVVNRKVGKDCAVEVAWTENDILYQVFRYQKHKKHGNSLHLYIDGEQVTASSNKLTQVTIDKLLGMPYDVFLHTVFFGQANDKKFSRITDSSRKELLDKVLNLEFLVSAKKNLDKVSEEWTEKFSAIERKLYELLAKRQYTEGTLQNLIHEQSTSLSKKKDKIFSLKNRVGKIQDDIDSKVTELGEDKDLKVSLEEKRKIIALTEVYDEKFTQKSSELQTVKTKLQYEESKANSLSRDIAALRKEVSKLSLGDECKYCEQKITETSIDNFREKRELDISRKEEELNTISDVISSLKEKSSSIKKEVVSIEAVLEKKRVLQASVRKLESRLDYVTNLERTISVLESEKKSTLAQISELEDDTTSEWESVIQDQKDILARLDLDYQSLSSEKDALLEEKKYIDFWTLGFGNSGIRSRLLDTALPILNEKVKYYTGKLTGGEVGIRFNTERELKSGSMKDEFTIDVKIGDSAAPSYGMASNGQKQRVDLCITWALQHLVSTRGTKAIRLAVFDEVFESLDSIGIEKSIELLYELQSDRDTIFCITHRSDLKDFFPDRILVKYEDSISHISEAHQSLPLVA